jgi:hypothetical protein
MCACLVFLILAILLALAYAVLHALWTMAGAILLLAVVLAIFGKKASAARKSGH